MCQLHTIILPIAITITNTNSQQQHLHKYQHRTRSLTHTLSHTKSFIHSLTYSLIRSSAYSPLPLIHLLTHVLIHYIRTPAVYKSDDTTAAKLSNAVRWASCLLHTFHRTVFFSITKVNFCVSFCFPFSVSLVCFAILALLMEPYILILLGVKI